MRERRSSIVGDTKAKIAGAQRRELFEALETLKDRDPKGYNELGIAASCLKSGTLPLTYETTSHMATACADVYKLALVVYGGELSAAKVLREHEIACRIRTPLY